MSVTITTRGLLAIALTCALALAPGASLAQDETPGPSPSAEPITSPAGDWVVTAFDAWEQGLAEPLPGSTLRLSLLDDGTLDGETACGRFTGGWSAEGAELFMGVAPTGNLGCAQEPTAEAIGLSTALAAVATWEAIDDAIELRDAFGATRVVLGTDSAGDPIGEWDIVRFQRPNGEMREPRADGPMTVTLGDDVIGGDTGCRPLVGAYALDGAGITLGPLEADGEACDGPLARAERQLLRALGEVVYWRQTGAALTLLDGFDEPLVDLIRVPEAEE